MRTARVKSQILKIKIHSRVLHYHLRALEPLLSITINQLFKMKQKKKLWLDLLIKCLKKLLKEEQ